MAAIAQAAAPPRERGGHARAAAADGCAVAGESPQRAPRLGGCFMAPSRLMGVWRGEGEKGLQQPKIPPDPDPLLLREALLRSEAQVPQGERELKQPGSRLAALAALAMLSALAASSCQRRADPARLAATRQAEADLRRLVIPAAAMPRGCTYADPAGPGWPYPVAKNPHVTAEAAPARAMAKRWPGAFAPADLEAVMWCLLGAGGDLGTESFLFRAPETAEQAAHRLAALQTARPGTVLYKDRTVAVIWRDEGVAEPVFSALVADARGVLGDPKEALPLEHP
jgi:hypothetical protein